ncbi:MAG TPA: methyltransferase domain-containing protein [Candidatus Binatia bacterium]
MGLIEAVHGRYVHKRRIQVLSDWCSRLIPAGSKVLDVGCGDGRLARLIAEKRPDVSIRGIDVRQRSDAVIPVDTFDGTSIPYGKSSFDVVMFVDVLHHTSQPTTLVREAVRVARRAIVIKDHLAEGQLDHLTLRVMDWVGNARHGVALPYDYWSLAKWRRVFDELGLRINSWESNLKLYPLPADLILGRSLHFIALLGTPGSSEVHVRYDKTESAG